MVRKALFVRMEVTPGRESNLEKFLCGGLAIVNQEPATRTWYAIRLGQTTFALFDTFPDDAGREAYLAGQAEAALMTRAPNLLAREPSIEKADVLASKIPGSE
jgi:quinol monooxygenase YgiN